MAESDKNKRSSSSLHAEKDISKLKVMQSAEADGIAAKYCMERFWKPQRPQNIYSLFANDYCFSDHFVT